ncbi:MAG: hypothetical protein NVS3B26_25230 [Mycobacteriales bacterium]
MDFLVVFPLGSLLRPSVGAREATIDGLSYVANPERLAVIESLALRGHLVDEDLDAIVATLANACRVPVAVVNIVTPNRQTYPAERGVGAPGTEIADSLSFCAEVVRSGLPLVVPDARVHAVYARNPLVESGALRSYAGEPLRYGRHVVGALSMFDVGPRVFSAADLNVLHSQARLANAVLRLRSSATWDALTGLASRGQLLEQVDRALSSGHQPGRNIALLLLDVVGLGAVNEELGSVGGDVILTAVADRLTTACGPRDCLARVGGDQFAVLFGDPAAAQDAVSRAAAVEVGVRGPIRVGATTVDVQVRCGLTITPSGNADALLAAAERNARSGGDQAPGSGARTPPSVDAVELRRAIDEGQLTLHYQPIVEMGARRVVGVEALVRWLHPVRGLLPPLEFIPLAEATGLITDLGDWILRTGASQAAAWANAGRDLDVAINLSPLQLARPAFADQVAVLLEQVRGPMQHLVLEITESALLDQPHTVGALTRLRSLGLRLALDDFGTGYCSFAYLRRFPIDAIKIDRSFVAGLGRNADDEAIVASIVGLARATGKTVVAEGVETPEQEALLRNVGVRYAQGFLWARALPPHEVLPWVDAYQSGAGGPPPATAARTAHAAPATPGSSRADRIMQIHAEGTSAYTIAAMLNRDGLRTDRGVRWHAASVTEVIARCARLARADA